MCRNTMRTTSPNHCQVGRRCDGRISLPRKDPFPMSTLPTARFQRGSLMLSYTATKWALPLGCSANSPGADDPPHLAARATTVAVICSPREALPTRCMRRPRLGAHLAGLFNAPSVGAGVANTTRHARAILRQHCQLCVPLCARMFAPSGA